MIFKFGWLKWNGLVEAGIVK